MERPVYFLPSEVSRLVLGYLKETEHVQSYKCFLKECKHLSEYADMLKQGIEYPTTIMGISLLTMLQEYARLKLKETSLQGVDMGTALKQFDAVTKTAQQKNYSSKTTPSSQPRKRLPRRSTACREDSKNNSEKDDYTGHAETEELSSVKPVCLSTVRVNPLIPSTRKIGRRKLDNKEESVVEVKMSSQIFSLTPSSSGVACKELEFPDKDHTILRKRKKRKSRVGYRHKYCNKKKSGQVVGAIDGHSDQEGQASDGNMSDDLPDLDHGISVVPGRTDLGHRMTETPIVITNSTKYSYDAKSNIDRRKNGDNGDMSDDSLSRSDVVFDSTHPPDFDLDLNTDQDVIRKEQKKAVAFDVRMVPSSMSDSSHTDSHALHIDQQSPVKMTSLQQLREQRTPVKAFLQESQTCDSGKSPRRKRHQPKRHSDSLEVLVPTLSNLTPPVAPSLPQVNPPSQHKEDTMGQTDPFPMLLEKIINDTKLHERLAETINKSRFTNHPHIPCNKPVPTATIVDDFFSPGGHNMLSEDTIDGIIHMTKSDPLFDSLLSILGPEGAKAVVTTIGASTTTTTTTAPCDKNNSAFVSVSENDMMELSQDGFTTSTAPTGTVDNPSNTPHVTSEPVAGVSSPYPILSSPCSSLSSSVGSPGQPTNQKKRRIKPTPCHPLTSVLPAFSSPVMHEMSPAESCSPAPSPYFPASTSAQNSLMSPPPCTATHNPLSSPAPFQHQSSPAPYHQPLTPAHQPSTPAHQPSTPAHQPSTPAHQPSTPGHQPSTPGHQPSIPAHQPSTPAHQPSTPAYQSSPAQMDHQPSPAMITQMSPTPIQYQSSTVQLVHQLSPAPVPYQPSSASVQEQQLPASFNNQPSPAHIQHQPLLLPVQNQLSPASTHNQQSPAPIQNQPSPYGQQSLMSPPATIPVHRTVVHSPAMMNQHQPCSPSSLHATNGPVTSPASSITSVALSVHSIASQHPASPFLPQPSSYVLQDAQATTPNLSASQVTQVSTSNITLTAATCDVQGSGTQAPQTSSQILSHVDSCILAKDSAADNHIPPGYSQQTIVPQAPICSSSMTPASIQEVQAPANTYQEQALNFTSSSGAGALLNVSSLCQAMTATSEASVTNNKCLSSKPPVTDSVASMDNVNARSSIETSSLTSVPTSTLVGNGSDQFPGLIMLASAATTSQQTVQIIPAQNTMQTLTLETIQPHSNVIIPHVQVQSLTSEPEVMAEQSDTSMSGVNISIQENGIIEAFSKGKASTCSSILPLTSIPKVSVRSCESPPAGSAQHVTKTKKKSGKKPCLKDTSMMDSNQQAINSLANGSLYSVTSQVKGDLNTVTPFTNGGLQTVTQLPDGIVSLQTPVPPVTDAQSILGPLASGNLPPGTLDTVHTSNTQMSFDLLAENNLSQFALPSPKKGNGSPCPNVSYPTVVINDQVYELAMSPNSQSLNVRNPKPLVETQMNSRPTVTVIAPQLPIVKQSKKRKNKKKAEQPVPSTLSPVLSALKNVVRQQTPKGERPNILSKSPKPLSKSGLPTDGYFVSPSRTSEENTDHQKQSSSVTRDYVAIPIGKIFEEVPKRSLSFESDNTSASTLNVKETSKKKTCVKTNKATKLKKEKVHGSSKSKNATESRRQTAVKENGEKTIEKNANLSAIKPCCVSVTPLKQTAGTRLMSTTHSNSSPIVQRFKPLLDEASSTTTKKVRILEPVSAKTDSSKSVQSSIDTHSVQAQGTSPLGNLQADDRSQQENNTQAPEPANHLDPQSKDLFKAHAVTGVDSPQTQNLTKSPVKPDINGNCGVHSEDSLSQDSSVMTAASDPGPVFQKGAPVGMRGRKMVAMTVTAQSQQKINGSSTSFILAGNRKRTSSQVAFEQNGGEKIKKKKKVVNLEKINLDQLLSKIHKK